MPLCNKAVLTGGLQLIRDLRDRPLALDRRYRHLGLEGR